MSIVLVLAYDFPPYVSVGGLRPYSWYKYLNEFGLYPVVVTRQWGNKYGNHLDYVAQGDTDKTIVEESEFGVVIRTPYKPNVSNRLLLNYGVNRFRFIRKVISAWYELAQWFLPLGPKVGIYYEAKKFLKQNKVDVIIATGDPFILFRYANILSIKYKIPWIADYRDPWIQDKTRNQNKFLLFIEHKFEKRMIKNAALFVTVSSYVNALVNSGYKKKYAIVSNGFDVAICSKYPILPKLTIAFGGTVYAWHPIKEFLNTCNSFAIDGQALFQINFYGVSNQDSLVRYVDENCGFLKDSVYFFPRMDNSKLLNEMANANLLLLFNDYSIMGTKIYDYLAVKRRILLCFSNDAESYKLKEKYYNLKEFENISKTLQADLIMATNSGIVVRDSEHLKEVLKDLYIEFQQKGYIECNSHGIEQYSRKKQTEKLAEIIKKVIDEHKQSMCNK